MLRSADMPTRRLKALCDQDPGGGEVVNEMLSRLSVYDPGQNIPLQSSDVFLVASGWACATKVLANGGTQVLNLILPGDIIGQLGPRRPQRLISAITALRLCDATIVTGLGADGHLQYPKAHHALKEMQLDMDEYVYEQVVRLGSLGAYERVGHLFMEIFARLHAVGLTNGNQFLMPLSQKRLGEMLGLSETHVNRTLRQLRRDGLVTIGPGWFALPDRERMAPRVGWSAASPSSA